MEHIINILDVPLPIWRMEMSLPHVPRLSSLTRISSSRIFTSCPNSTSLTPAVRLTVLEGKRWNGWRICRTKQTRVSTPASNQPTRSHRNTSGSIAQPTPENDIVSIILIQSSYLLLTCPLPFISIPSVSIYYWCVPSLDEYYGWCVYVMIRSQNYIRKLAVLR